ncbi:MULTISPECIES: serpin family protein [Halorussus]|uniref:serpin family protein n=1 Tax=Halorussus TaxID=1070314 RepID=UPI0020A1E9F7|nr:serpin family protein [Halorussus vallis]USZ76643.1 serpin family protein [Halorussus vallis]
MDRRHLLSALAGIGASTAGCLAPGATVGPVPAPANVPETDVPENVNAPTDGYVAGNADFGFALLERLADDAPSENRFVSPYSLGVALAMTYAGARGQTRTNVAETLRFRPTGEDLHRSVAALRSALPLDEAGESDARTTARSGNRRGGVPLRFAGANALWGQVDYPFGEDFLKTLKRYYGAGLGRVNFEREPDAARRAINGWVAERTRGKVPELFGEDTIDRRTRLVLANAVYFRANWADAFDEANTERKPFTTLDGATDAVATMHQKAEFPFAEVEGVKVLELPYAGENADMALLLPPRDRFREFERGFDAERLSKLLGATEATEVKVRLPRFEFRSSLELSRRLEAMGMTTAFTPSADFGGMAEGSAGESLQLGSVAHEAYVKVDERGTEAAAATGVEVTAVSYTPARATFAADRPFLFVIRHRPTGAPLFLGRVADPAAD